MDPKGITPIRKLPRSGKRLESIAITECCADPTMALIHFYKKGQNTGVFLEDPVQQCEGDVPVAANRLYACQAASWLHFFSAERWTRHDQTHDTKEQHETPNLKWRNSRDLGTRQVSIQCRIQKATYIAQQEIREQRAHCSESNGSPGIVGGLEQWRRERPDPRPYAYFANIARNASSTRTWLDVETKVVLWMAADAPQPTRNEFFLVFLVLLRTTPCSFLTICGSLEEKSTSI